MTELEVYLRKWCLERDGPATETPRAWLQPVLRAGRPAMLKRHKPTSDEASSAALLRYYAGVGAVELLEGDERAPLMERASGPRSLAALALAGQDGEAARVLAETVAGLHAPRPTEPPRTLTPLAVQFESLFEREGAHPLLAASADVARSLLSEPGEQVPLHGDMHHDNVLDGAARGWLAIDPKGLLGERSYEVANLLRNPWPHGELVHDRERMRGLANFYAGALDLDAERVLAFAMAHAGLSASWAIEEGEDPGYSLECVRLLLLLVAR